MTYEPYQLPWLKNVIAVFVKCEIHASDQS